MFDVLLSGKLRGIPEVRTSRNGNPFATFRLNVPSGKDGGYTQASCIAFSQTVIDAVQALTDGDSLAVAGEAAIKTWEGKHGLSTGLDVTAHAAMTAYQVKKKRGTAAGEGKATHGPDQPPQRDGSAGEARTRPKFEHPDFQQPEMGEPPDGWNTLDGV